MLMWSSDLVLLTTSVEKMPRVTGFDLDCNGYSKTAMQKSGYMNAIRPSASHKRTGGLKPSRIPLMFSSSDFLLPRTRVMLENEPVAWRGEKPFIVVCQHQSGHVDLITFDRSDQLPVETWMRVFGYLRPCDLSTCMRVKKRLCGAVRLVLYASIQFRSFAQSWSFLNFWKRKESIAYKRVPRAIEIGPAVSEELMMDVRLRGLVDSFYNLQKLTIINQTIQTIDLFCILNGKRLSSLILKWVVFDDITVPNSRKSESQVVIPTPSEIVLIGVSWSPYNDPTLMLPRTVASKSLTSLELDMRSFMMVTLTFGVAKLVLAEGLRSYKLWPTPSLSGLFLCSGYMEELRRMLLAPTSALENLEIRVTCQGSGLPKGVPLPRLLTFHGPVEMLPMLVANPSLERLHLRVDIDTTTLVGQPSMLFLSVKWVGLTRWTGSLDLLANLLHGTPNVETFRLQSQAHVGKDALMPVGRTLTLAKHLQRVEICVSDIIGCKDVESLSTGWLRLLTSSVEIIFLY
ncbi:hypothetical protein PM082_023439 [Marasmius tenuissimus]|nr:hypothetical protein PM082_023439 [Marasmius tenuissimus]